MARHNNILTFLWVYCLTKERRYAQHCHTPIRGVGESFSGRWHCPEHWFRVSTQDKLTKCREVQCLMEWHDLPHYIDIKIFVLLQTTDGGVFITLRSFQPGGCETEIKLLWAVDDHWNGLNPCESVTNRSVLQSLRRECWNWKARDFVCLLTLLFIHTLFVVFLIFLFICLYRSSFLYPAFTSISLSPFIFLSFSVSTCSQP
jgi:hypothetical protein